MEGGLELREADDPLEQALDKDHERIGERSIENELLRKARVENGPLGFEEVEAMSTSTSPSTGRLYGIDRVCAARGVPRSSHYAQRARRRALAAAQQPPAPVTP